MYAQALISLREGFEALLLVVVVISFLRKVGWGRYEKFLILGALLGVLGSIVTGVIAFQTYVLIEQKTLAEAIGAFVAVVVLTSVIYWMARHSKDIKSKVEEEVRAAISTKGVLGITTLGFIFVFREGFETVLFLLPLIFIEPLNTLSGILIGILGSLLLSYGIFKMGFKMNIRSFFYFTSILLIFIASGILGYGVHEFLEFGEDSGWAMEPWSEYVYNFGLSTNNIMHEKNLVGGILSVLFGYSTKMELARVLFQFTYLIMGLILVVYIYERRSV